jgi:RNA polymerase sigma-70 factor (ECF subfamily)
MPHLSIIERSSESLVADAKLGDEIALAELWNRHNKVVRNAIWRIARNREDVEDSLQETYLKCYLHIGQFDGRAKFSTWLVRIAINSALMLLRKRRGRPEASMVRIGEDFSMQVVEYCDPSEDVESCYIRSECRDRLRVAMLNLHPSMRSIFELRHELGLSIKEIAAISGLTVPATKARLFRARIALRTSLLRHTLGNSQQSNRSIRQTTLSDRGVQFPEPHRSQMQ